MPISREFRRAVEQVIADMFAIHTANASGALTLTTDYQDVPGATVTLEAVGTYIIWGAFQFDHTGGASVSSCIGILVVDGVGRPGDAELGYVSNGERVRGSVGRPWTVTTTKANTVAKLMARKATDNGSSTCTATDTVIMAVRIP